MLRAASRAAREAAHRLKGASGLCYAAGREVAATAAAKASASPAVSAVAVSAMAVTMGTSVAFAAASPNSERSFIMVKPDGVHRGVVGQVIARFEQRGYKLVGLKVLVPSRELAGKHYAEHEGKPFYPKLVDFLSSGAVVAMVFEGKDIVKTGRTMIGATNPLASAPGTIRGDLAVDVGRNMIHGSDSVDSAQREIALWFTPDDLADYELATKSWIYE